MDKRVSLVLLVILSSLLLWLPFILRVESLPGWQINFSKGMDVVYANFDGPNYLIIAKSWYDKTFIARSFSNPLPLEYYPAHLPLYPSLVKVADIALPGTAATVAVTLAGSVLAYWMFYEYLLSTNLSKRRAWWLAVVFLILPARWLAVRSVGSPEPWFVFFILASMFNFKKKKWWLAAAFGGLAQLTKSPGVLLFVGYGVYFLKDWWMSRDKKINRLFAGWPTFLGMLVVLPLFWFYQVRTGDFFAYFNSGDNFHLFFPPFSIFSPQGQYWTGDFWLEEVIWIWLVYGLSVFKLWRAGFKAEASFAGVFFLSTLFVAHRDIARYILPISPFLILGWKEELVKKEFRILLLILVVPIYLYSWNFLLNNTAPVADWTPYL